MHLSNIDQKQSEIMLERRVSTFWKSKLHDDDSCYIQYLFNEVQK